MIYNGILQLPFPPSASFCFSRYLAAATKQYIILTTAVYKARLAEYNSNRPLTPKPLESGDAWLVHQLGACK